MNTPHNLAAIRALKDELEQLNEQQRKLLKLAVFGGMTPEEAKEYDEGQRRITKLIERLAVLEKAKSA